MRFASHRLAICLIVWSACAFAAHAQTPPTVRFAAIADPLIDTAVYALQKGLVRSDKVQVEVRTMPLPALLEAFNSRQFDIMQAGATLIPKMAAAGVPVRIVGRDYGANGNMGAYAVLVRQDSNIHSLSDLKGRSLAVEALGSTNTFQLRAVLQKAGLDTFKATPDVTLKQMPMATMPVLLRNGGIDAAYLFYAGLYPFRDDKEFRSLGSPPKLYNEQFNANALISLKIAFEPTLKERGPLIKAAVDLLEESRLYYEKNPQLVEEAVAKADNVDRAYLEWGRMNGVIVGGPLQPDELAKDLNTIWALEKSFGEIKSIPNPQELIWVQ